MIYPKILKVKIHSNFELEVLFEGNIKKLFDFKSKWNNPIFEPLKSFSFFKKAKVDIGGYGISWNDELDISEYEIWSKGKDL